MALAGRFPSLDPFKIRRERARVVFSTVRRLNDYDTRETLRDKHKGKKKNVIRRKADDSWF